MLKKSDRMVIAASGIVFSLAIGHVFVLKVLDPSFDIYSALGGLSTIVIAGMTGVYVKTTLGQLTVMSRQLDEMKLAREYTAQPLPDIRMEKVFFEEPNLFNDPTDGNLHSVLSRLFFKCSIANNGSSAAINVCVVARVYPNSDKEMSIKRTRYIDIVPAGGNPFQFGFMFNGDVELRLLSILRENNFVGPRGWPVFNIKIAFKNVHGGHFLLEREFYLFRKDGSEVERLKNWQTFLSTFAINYGAEASELARLRNANDKAWSEKFNALKSIVKKSVVPGDLELGCVGFPEKFKLTTLDNKAYDEFLAQVNVGIPLNKGGTMCDHVEHGN